MIFRGVALALCAAFLCAATEPSPAPAALQPYLNDGRYDPGDYGLLRGRFQDATPEQEAAYLSVMRWANECRTAAIAELRAQLASEGFPDASVENTGPGPLVCRTVLHQPQVTDNASFAAFEREAAAARPVVQAYLMAAKNAEEAARPRAGDLARQLEYRIVGEQVIRMGLTWVMNKASDFPGDVAARARDRPVAPRPRDGGIR